ncbi:hypothetical protein PF003_g31975 [Phytophthora fragariae]|nr:hypothetical protein PF003_g31975 [Phytophthora fragariae]
MCLLKRRMVSWRVIRKVSDPEYTKQNPEYKEIFQNKFSKFDGSRGDTGGIGRTPSAETI